MPNSPTLIPSFISAGVASIKAFSNSGMSLNDRSMAGIRQCLILASSTDALGASLLSRAVTSEVTEIVLSKKA